MAFHARPLAPDIADRSAAGELAIIAQVRTRHCAFFASDVTEVMRPLPIEGLANVPRFVLGLSIIRGAPTPVIDAGALLGEDPARAQPRRLVVMRVAERRVALAVEGVLGVRTLARETLLALPPLLQHATDEAVAAVSTLDAQLLTVLGDTHLVPPAVWEQLCAAAKVPA